MRKRANIDTHKKSPLKEAENIKKAVAGQLLRSPLRRKLSVVIATQLLRVQCRKLLDDTQLNNTLWLCIYHASCKGPEPDDMREKPNITTKKQKNAKAAEKEPATPDYDVGGTVCTCGKQNLVLTASKAPCQAKRDKSIPTAGTPPMSLSSTAKGLGQKVSTRRWLSTAAMSAKQVALFRQGQPSTTRCRRRDASSIGYCLPSTTNNHRDHRNDNDRTHRSPQAAAEKKREPSLVVSLPILLRSTRIF